MSREMKNSGIEWIGDIPKDWAITKLKNIIDFISGYAFKSEFFTISDNNKKVITIKSFNNKQIILNNLSYSKESLEFPTKYLLKNNDILFAMSGGTTGKNLLIEQVDDLYYINQRVGIIRSSFNKFIYYYINTGLFSEYIYLFSLGSAQPNISATDIQNFIIALPEKETIKKIEIYIDYQLKIISNIIDTTYQSIEELKKYKQSLITEAVTKGLDSTVEMKDSGIEPMVNVPKHWKINKIKYLFELYGGLNITKKNLIDTGIPVINYGEIHSKYGFHFDLRYDVVQKVDSHYLEYKNSLINQGDFIFADTSEDIEGSGNFTCYLNEEMCFAGSHTIILKSKKFINYFYFSYLFESLLFRSQIQKKVEGIKVYSITQRILKSLILFEPPAEEQQQIVQYLDKKIFTIDSLIKDKTKVIEELENYKKSLIYEYVTGKKEV